MFTTL